MRKLFTLFILLFSVAVTAYAQGSSLDAVTTSDTSLRSGPGTEWRRISVLASGTAIRLDGQAPGGGWVRGITQNNEQGWVVNTSLNLSEEQLATLPSKWVDDPFTISAPGGAGPAAPPAEQAPAEA